MHQADSSDPPPASPSSAGAERSRHFCPFLSRSRSRAPCVRDPAPQGRRDRFRPRPLRGAAGPASPSPVRSPLLSLRPSSRPRPAARRQRSAAGGRGGKDALGYVSSMFHRSGPASWRGMGITRKTAGPASALELTLEFSRPARPEYPSTSTSAPEWPGCSLERPAEAEGAIHGHRGGRGRGDLSWNPRGTRGRTPNLSRTFRVCKNETVVEIDLCGFWQMETEKTRTCSSYSLMQSPCKILVK
ncbi:uncharacterized protein LOC120235824 [Hyaena hyaena]|uniref:uncharacterized protein LOC120235824 n=1 Tax=Hyaena hyaena TaxID=95912 RepID=UPI0019219D60|nr:uncharacterized protein LOC120235824 [Hyaena hyaena]